MYRLEEGIPTVEEYRRLREAVGWGTPSDANCSAALTSSQYAVVARHDGHAVGMARLVGDRFIYLLIVDVVVHPDHQGSGLGRCMVGKLVDWAHAQGTRHTLLVAHPDLIGFYESVGFCVDTSCVMKPVDP